MYFLVLVIHLPPKFNIAKFKWLCIETVGLGQGARIPRPKFCECPNYLGQDSNLLQILVTRMLY